MNKTRTTLTTFANALATRKRTDVVGELGQNEHRFTVDIEDRSLRYSPPMHDWRTVTQQATQQLCTTLRVPYHYFDHTLSEHPGLAQRIISTEQVAHRKRVMVRVSGGAVIGVVSPRYRRIDNAPLLRELSAYEWPVEVVFSGEHLGRLYLRFYFPHTETRIDNKPNYLGFDVYNSEIGTGAATVRPIIYTKVCTNGLCLVTNRGEMARRVHIGREHDDGVITHYYDSELEAVRWLAVAIDLSVLTLSKSTGLLDQAMAASEARADDLQALVYLNESGLITQEVYKACCGIYGSTYPYSLWGLASSLTEVAKRYDIGKRLELESLAGTIITWTPSMWRHANAEE